VADPLIIQTMTQIVYSFRPDLPLHIDEMQVVHSGNQLFLDITICLPSTTTLIESNAIEAELQATLQCIEQIDRVAIHLRAR
jgi:divalent metal cation (Fe/Co/Zn/Cd) transporter